MKYIVLLILILTCTESFAQKITALTEDTSPTTDDLTVIVNDPAGTPTTKKATLANIFKSHNLYTDVNNNLGIGTSIPQGGLTVMNGNVGLGTWKPVSLLHVNGNILANSTSVPAGANAALIAVGDGTNRAFEQFNAGTDTNGMLVWGGANASTGNALRLRGNATNGGTSYIFTDFATTEGDLVFGTYSNRTKQLYLSKTGNIGIGTTTPGGGFTVMAAGNVGFGTWLPQGPVEIVDSSGSASTLKLRRGASTAAIGMSSTMNGDTSDLAITPGSINGFAVGTISVFGINKNGNVGIGTTTPVGAMAIMSGNVGIGTWVPGTAMDINGYLRIQGAGNELDFTSLGGGTGYGRIYASTLGLFIQNMASSGSIIFGNIGTAERMRIDSSGNIGIGTSIPATLLEVGVKKFNITSSGNVGIGSIAPGAILSIPSLKSTTGTRYLCIDTVGNVSSSASACSGT